MSNRSPIGFGSAMGRALTLAIGNCAFFALPYFALTWLGMNPIPAAAIGIIFVLSPGVYDYLDRDLAGRRIKDDDPIEGDTLFLRLKEGKFTRPEDNGLNSADFIWLSTQLNEGHRPLAPMVAELDRATWQSLDPGSELAIAIFESISDKIEDIPEWTNGHELPLVGLFWADLERLLAESIGVDFEPVQKRDAQKRQLN